MFVTVGLLHPSLTFSGNAGALGTPFSGKAPSFGNNYNTNAEVTDNDKHTNLLLFYGRKRFYSTGPCGEQMIAA